MARREVQLYLTIMNAPAGVLYSLQDLTQPTLSTGADMVFKISIEVAENGRAYGPFAKGTPDKRFAYINIGTMAGQLASPWTRRLKIPLDNLPVGDSLSAKINGTGKDGSPACATVKLVVPWQVSHNI